MPVTLRQRTVKKGQYTEDYEADLPLPPNPKFVHPDIPFNPNARPAVFPTIPLGQRYIEPPPEHGRVQRLLKEIDPNEPDPPTDEELLNYTDTWTMEEFQQYSRVTWIMFRTADFTNDISKGMKLFLGKLHCF